MTHRQHRSWAGEYFAAIVACFIWGCVAGTANAQTVLRHPSPPAGSYLLRATVESDTPMVVPGAPSQWNRIGPGLGEIVARVTGGEHTLAPGAPDRGLPHVARYVRGLLSLRIDGQTFPLTDGVPVPYRRGPLYATAQFHSSLGPYGHAETWVSVTDDEDHADVQILWHRAIPGPAFAFQRAELIAPVPWTPAVPDPACLPPFLVQSGSYTFAQQQARAFYVTVGTPHREYVGTARDHYMGFPLPDPGPWPIDTADARYRLANMMPEEDHEPAPTSVLWPASGEYGGGAGGGIGRYPLDGIRWASGAADGLEFYRIGLLRGLARARVRLDYDGGPLRVPASKVWRFWDGFLDGYDAPWEWDRWGPGNAGPWSDHDSYGIVRRARHAWVLALLANDPIARLMSLELATRARLTFHDTEMVPTTPGDGSGWGVWQGVAGMSVAVARDLGATEYGPWINAWRGYLATVQMPSGEVTNRLGGYPSELPPFGGAYRLSGAADLAYLMLALHRLGGADAVVQGMGRAAFELGTPDDGRAGLFYYWPTATVDPYVPLIDRSDWPAWLVPWMGLQGGEAYLTAWDQGYITSIVDTPEMWSRWGATVPEMRAWGAIAPDSHTRAPVEQWWTGLVR